MIVCPVEAFDFLDWDSWQKPVDFDRRPMLPVRLGFECPVCGKQDWCLRREDGSAAICPRTPDGPTAVRQCGEAGTLHVLNRASLRPSASKPRRRPIRRKQLIDVRREVEQFFSYPRAAYGRRELASILGVSEQSLERLGVGWHGSSRGFWLFPERDGIGNVIGGNHRLRDGSKKQLTGSVRGLTFDPNSIAGDGPLFLVEGGSDVAALMTIGLTAVGRPSNRGGIEHLVRLIEGIAAARPIVAIAEHDEKPNGTCPGRDGAIFTALRLEELTARQVHWAWTPDGAKDSRAWLNSRPADVDRVELGSSFAAAVLSALNPEDHQSASDVVTRDLVGWQDEMQRRRLASVDDNAGPAIYLDRSPTGSGKSHGDLAMIQKTGEALIVTPTHENSREAIHGLAEAGIFAVKFPKRISQPPAVPLGEPQNCFNPAADHAQAVGLSVVAAVCGTCQYRDDCGYLRGIKAANDAVVSVATHKRAELEGLIALIGSRPLASIHENMMGILRPTETVEASSLEFTAPILDRLLIDPQFLNQISTGQRDFILHCSATVETIAAAARTADRTVEVSLPRGLRMPGGIQRLLFLATVACGQSCPAGCWKAILAAAEGTLERLVVQVDEGGRRLLAVWRNDPPATATVWISDATADAAALADLIGRPVNDQTPGGRLQLRKSAAMIPVDVTRGTSPRKVLALIRHAMLSRPTWQRVGIICHRKHLREIERFKYQGGLFGSRIAKVSYFGSGDDRASNAWYRDCDSLMILGTPRPGGRAVANFLIQCGEIEAAGVKNPEWTQIAYEAELEAGEQVTVKSLGYTDPRWQRAHLALCRSALIQAIGRGRGVRDDGIPVLVFSTEDCGLRVSSIDADPLSEAEAKILAFMWSDDDTGDQVTFPIKNLYRKSDPIRARKISDATRIGFERTKRHLQSLESRGLVEKIGGGHATKWQLSARSVSKQKRDDCDPCASKEKRPDQVDLDAADSWCDDAALARGEPRSLTENLYLQGAGEL